MASQSLKSLAAGFTALGVIAAPFAANAFAEDPTNAQVRTVSASDAQNVNFNAARNFIIRYNPNAEGFSPSALEGTVSDIHRAGCPDVQLDDSRRYGSFYNLKAPWLGENFRVDDVGTVGTIAIDLCRDGDLDSGPA